jgi:hypothetical protein
VYRLTCLGQGEIITTANELRELHCVLVHRASAAKVHDLGQAIGAQGQSKAHVDEGGKPRLGQDAMVPL